MKSQKKMTSYNLDLILMDIDLPKNRNKSQMNNNKYSPKNYSFTLENNLIQNVNLSKKCHQFHANSPNRNSKNIFNPLNIYKKPIRCKKVLHLNSGKIQIFSNRLDCNLINVKNNKRIDMNKSIRNIFFDTKSKFSNSSRAHIFNFHNIQNSKVYSNNNFLQINNVAETQR